MTATSAFFAAWARLAAQAKHDDLIAERNAWIATACLDGVLALGAAALNIHLSFLLITLAAICARIAVVTHRRADSIRPRAMAADLAEGGDIALAEAA